MTLYRFPAIACLALFFLMACDKKTDLDIADRKAVAAGFRLKAVVNNAQDTLEQYTYDAQQRMAAATVRVADRYVFKYTDGATLPAGMNNITFTYEQSKLTAVTGPRTVTAIEYPDADRIVIRQTRYPLIPKQPPVKDTLILYRNASRVINRAALLPEGSVASFTYDNNPIAYTNITDYLLPVLLQYPLKEMIPSLVAAYSGHNLLRYTLGPGITAGEVPVMKTTDYAYRFDQLLFDVPTMQEQHSVTTDKVYFLYY
ncbi:hypothetical protein [Chitinophaga nivalis]|uniref:DUF3857 domain-containing protein n=1 Tax=Chitinophaga nivalis TaxID=2991709 RepID=A0ABT3IG98_9BACT|nr:hypothetical protein [Chitinophaga nivalis]MCW3467326.1 hypothetical protein [Chitinophaga nivalis]MCW3482982.1 hypothetical protein [Chitinophaga nivalis]